jgi:hypothetical protein
MGSSAAYACVLSVAVNLIVKSSVIEGELELNKTLEDDITPFADYMEKLFHTNPSGCDV